MNRIIRTFQTDKFAVTVTAIEDNDLDLSFDDDGEVRRKLESGELEAFAVKAALYFRGEEIASDYLGGCIYESPAAFMDHRGIRRYCPPGGKPGQCGSYFSDMVRGVISEGRKILSEIQRLHIRAA